MLRYIVTLCVTLGIAATIGCGEILPSRADPTPTPTFSQAKHLVTNRGVAYEDLYQDNERYQGDIVLLRGQVVQVIADGNSDRYELRVAVTPRFSTARQLVGYENPVYVHYRGPVRLLEDDIVEIVGEVKGLKTYKTTSDTSVTIPEIKNAWLKLIK